MKSICIPCSAKRLREDEAGRGARRLRLIGLAIAGAGILASTGCSSLGAKPWEHDLLAQPAMQVDPYPLESASDDHIYFSKEASSGGRSFAGGGCGCN